MSVLDIFPCAYVATLITCLVMSFAKFLMGFTIIIITIIIKYLIMRILHIFDILAPVSYVVAEYYFPFHRLSFYPFNKFFSFF